MGNDDLVIRVLRDLQDRVGDLQDRVGDLQDNVGELRVETRANTSAITDMGGRLDVVEETLKDVAGQQLMLTKYVKHSIGRHERAIEGLDDRVTRLEDEA